MLATAEKRQTYHERGIASTTQPPNLKKKKKI
jgi:hypothetical protein